MTIVIETYAWDDNRGQKLFTARQEHPARMNERKRSAKHRPNLKRTKKFGTQNAVAPNFTRTTR